MEEAIAQLLFWCSMATLPVGLVVIGIGLKCRLREKAIGYLAVGSLLLTHFVWYFQFLGYGLTHKVGPYKPPLWHHSMPFCIISIFVLIVIWIVKEKIKR